MKCHSSNTASLISHPFRKVAPFLCSALLGLLTACGGSSTPVTPTPTPGTTSVQVNVGDGPADWMLAFSMNVSSMSLTGSSGSVNVASTSTPVEMIHRLGIMEPIAVVSAPQGTYTGASITIASCNVTYLDPITKTLQQQTIAGPITAAIPFTSSVTVGTTPLAFNFDLDLENSVTMDNTGKLHLSPTFHFATGAQGQGNANSAFNGGMQQMMGDINSTSTNSFTMTSLQATNTFTIMTNTATQFQGNINNMNMMAKGMGVLVTAALQADGTLLATRVRSKMNSGGIMGGGIITAVTGQPATQLTIVMQNGAGASMMPTYLSQTITVNLTSSTEFEIDNDRIDLSHLPFQPVFSASNIYAGQSVLPVSDTGNTVSGMSGNTAGTITASSLRLQEQGFRGTTDVAITPGASGTFTLTLMPGCAFTTLTGANKILVYQQTGTNVENNTAIPVGATLRVHGLLFQNAGQWTLIASTIAS
jgi:hypothetical protein